MKSATEILRQYSSGEIEMDEANAALASMGAGFHLAPGKGPGWTEQEMKEGFIPGDKPEAVLKDLDMSRKVELAGKTVVQRTAKGAFEVTYDERGYFRRSKNL